MPGAGLARTVSAVFRFGAWPGGSALLAPPAFVPLTIRFVTFGLAGAALAVGPGLAAFLPLIAPAASFLAAKARCSAEFMLTTRLGVLGLAMFF